ncbi:MAG: NAD-binding protein [Clostridia bacterium]
MNKDKIIIVGSGKLGSRLASLLSEQGSEVIILDKQESSFARLDQSFSGYTVCCDALDQTALEKVGIKQAKEVIIATESDDTNLLLSHICFYIYNVPRLYVRLANADKGQLLNDTTIKPIYPFLLSVEKYLDIKGETI